MEKLNNDASDTEALIPMSVSPAKFHDDCKFHIFHVEASNFSVHRFDDRNTAVAVLSL